MVYPVQVIDERHLNVIEEQIELRKSSSEQMTGDTDRLNIVHTSVVKNRSNPSIPKKPKLIRLTRGRLTFITTHYKLIKVIKNRNR